MRSMSPDGRFLAALLSVTISAASQLAYAQVNLEAQQKALDIIQDFATKLCGSVQAGGGVVNAELTGAAKADLRGVVNQVADLGIDGAAKYQSTHYEGVLQGDLAKLLSDQASCKLVVWKDLKDKLLSPGISPALKAPVAELRRIEPEITPLEKFSDKAMRVGSDTIYPVGATFKFDLVHNGPGDEVINIDGLDVRVDAFDPSAACPFTLTGDRIFGAGEAPLRVFTVHMAGGKVSSVQYKPARDEQMRRGKSNNLLDTEDSPPLRLQKAGDETEAMKVTFIVDDAAQYRIGLSIRYANRDGPKTFAVPSATICKPRE